MTVGERSERPSSGLPYYAYQQLWGRRWTGLSPGETRGQRKPFEEKRLREQGKYSGSVTDSFGRRKKGLKGRRSSKSFGKAVNVTELVFRFPLEPRRVSESTLCESADSAYPQLTSRFVNIADCP